MTMPNTEETPQAIYLKDYQKSSYVIEKTELWFELGECLTNVKSKLYVRRVDGTQEPLVLNGEGLRLIELYVDGVALMTEQFKVTSDKLTIYEVPENCQIEIEVEINPGANKSLSGLYTSNGNYCTQCESHGFRRITYFLDRPDIMSVFTTTITADVASFPHLLSNGNCIDRGDLPGGRHWVKWHDPSLKPSYLFALVAGSFEVLNDEFTTCSDRKVKLALYVEKGKVSQAGFAMSALKKSMRWDEETYNREYELDIYMIVAVSDFNFGAMENKGLNVFNDRYILAKGDTATDYDFLGVDVVIAHEYFHNWSGNRVTCRDWFQLSLKEGLTVYREEKYTEAVSVADVVRIQQAKLIQTAQFKEDSGPMAHPIRPSSYIDMNNFYTVTVYEKGAEVIRMIETLLGEATFKKALDEYFLRFDGQAVTTDDFVDVMEEVSGVDLKQFRLWYDQAGTPVVTIKETYDEKNAKLVVELEQDTPPTYGQAVKSNLHIPILFRFYGENGKVIKPKKHQDLKTQGPGQYLYSLKDSKEKIILEGIKVRPIVSCLEKFSAPVKLDQEMAVMDRIVLVEHGLDGYQRRFQIEQVYLEFLTTLLSCDHEDKFPMVPDYIVNVFTTTLLDEKSDPAVISEILALPKEPFLLEKLPGTDITKLCTAIQYLRREIASRSYDQLVEKYHQMSPVVPYQYNVEEVSKRSLRNFCLYMMNMAEDRKGVELAVNQYKLADNMTDMMGAIGALLNQSTPELDEVLKSFFDRWQHDPLVVDKWLSAQALSNAEDVLERVKKLTNHESFDIQNPNRVRALIGTFTHSNLAGFHREDGQGYIFLTKKVLQIQDFNPQLAARLVAPFLYWNRYDQSRQQLIIEQLRVINSYDKLKSNIYELVSRALVNAPEDKEETEEIA